MFSYQPLLRVTPPAGTPIVYDLAAIDRMKIAQWIPEPIFDAKETVRRQRKNISYGWRLRASFVWFVDPGSVSENTLVDIAFAVNRNRWLLELSMDNGGLYRAVVLDSWPPRTNIEDKNVAGLYQAEFVCVELLNEDSLPPETRQAPPGISGWS
jgi:hypothetical protein